MLYEDINDAYIQILKDLKNSGKIKAKRKELYFYTFTLENMDKNVLFFPFAQRNWPWILRELSDRIFRFDNPGHAYLYSKNWDNRREDSGLFSYHYSNRLGDQMKDMLSKRKQSRDKIVQVWRPGDYDLKGRQPCTITLQPIMEEDDRISLIVYMRNNDMINIFPSDIFIHSSYFKYWATYHGLEYKNLYWVSAVAYYQKKRDKLNFPTRLLNQWDTDYKDIITTKWDKQLLDDLFAKEDLEIDLRNKVYEYKQFNYKFRTKYVQEWYWIMLLAHMKQEAMKKEFDEIYNKQFVTEFKYIKESIVRPK